MKGLQVPRRSLLVILLVAGVIAGGTVILPDVERAYDEKIAQISAEQFAPYQKFYDLTRDVREVVRCDDPTIIRSLVWKAMLLESVAQDFKTDWNYGNAIHYANLALGRAALVNGDSSLAAAYLLKAAQTPGSPQLGDYGPDMTLALELLQCGQRPAVLEYVQTCEHFWYNRGQSPLKQWADVIRQGGTPEFGSRAGAPLRVCRDAA